MSVDGGRFFYPNPLSSDGKYAFNADNTVERQPWFGCACCPSNLCRFIPSFPGYMYAVKDRQLYINLFAGNTATMQVEGKEVVLEQQTNYPWDGDIALRIVKNQAKAFDLAIRIPGWVMNKPVPSDLYRFEDDILSGYKVMVNGQEVQGELVDGYMIINRLWKKGDIVSIHFDMPVRRVKANHHVADDRGRVAIERGPLVYCAEGVDNRQFSIFNFLLSRRSAFKVVDHVINGTRGVNFNVKAIEVSGQALDSHRDGSVSVENATLTMIPYYAWNHRGPGLMEVWMAQTIAAAGNY
jgi:DUF1680 family protein